MKMTLRAMVVALAFVAGATHAGPTEDFERRAADLTERVDKGEITELQQARETARYAEALFPKDYRFQALRNYRVLIASRMESGEIKRDEFDYLWSRKRLEYLADRDAARQQQAATEQAGNDLAIGTALGIMGRSITNATRPAGVNCVSVPIGTSVSTTCH